MLGWALPRLFLYMFFFFQDKKNAPKINKSPCEAVVRIDQTG
jgi:hypothetical protein